METKISIRRGESITPIIYIDKGQIKEINKYGNKFHEFYMLEAINDMEFPEGFFIDIGAHVGNHSIFFAKYCNAKVVSYEADKQTFAVLLKNITNSGMSNKITPINMAIGNENRTCSLRHNENRPGQSRVIKEPGDLIMTTISSIEETVSLIKIDVEGNELEVVEGCMDVIKRDSPELFIETFGDYKKVLNLLPKEYRMIKRYNNAPTYHFSTK